MNKAKILAITKQCEIFAEVELEFGIYVRKAMKLTGVDVIATGDNHLWLTETLKSQNVKLDIKDEGYGVYSATVFLGNTNVNTSALSTIAKEIK